MLSLGILLVNHLQVIKQTNTALNTSTNGVVGRAWVFLVVGSNPTSTTMKRFSDFPHVERGGGGGEPNACATG